MIELAILYDRYNHYKKAHELFTMAFDIIDASMGKSCFEKLDLWNRIGVTLGS